jgi:hypothetical protein
MRSAKPLDVPFGVLKEFAFSEVSNVANRMLRLAQYALASIHDVCAECKFLILLSFICPVKRYKSANLFMCNMVDSSLKFL